MAGRTVGASFARQLLDLAVSKGADRAALLAASGIAAQTLADHDGRVPFDSYVALMRAAKEATGDPALGLHYGEAVDIAQISIIGLIGQASETMLEAFQQLNRYVRLIVETRNADGGDRFRLAAERGGFWMVDNREDANAFPELTESAFAQLVCGPRRYGLGPVIKAVHVTHPDTGYREEYERIFRAPVVFGSDWNAMQLDLSDMHARVGVLPRYAFGVLNARADAMLASLEAQSTVRGEVESQLMSSLHTGDAGMDRIAGKLGMSRQTLFRRLKAEGTTFEAVLDDLRHRLALEYLAARKVSVTETAYLTGFTELSAFSRAFKRWTGASPKGWRAAA